MGTTVRELTDTEKEDLAALLTVIHAHVDDCVVCQLAPGKDGMCDVGRANDQRWNAWLEDHT